ncbi:MAG: hypothetical protein PHP54_02275 [Clostridia bacterium]|nr:hypothetical protein [Clostridia bacterium]
MNRVERRKLLKGSGVIVVIFVAIAFSIYTMTTFSENEHFSIMMNKYEKNNKEYYEKNIDDIENYYDRVILKNLL